jgi:hypothetical protein
LPAAESEDFNELYLFYDGENLDQKACTAAYLVTLGSDGWPHTAMISAGELLLEYSGARLALWEGSRTTANLLRDGKALIVAILSELSVRVRLGLESRGILPGFSGLHAFSGAVISVTADRAPYATLTSPVKFELLDREATISRWQRTHEALRRL